MADRLAGKVAIVTGAGSIGHGWGNGKATAVLFVREGAKVLLVDRNRDAVGETAEGCEGMVAACVEASGRLDVLRNNVGILAHGVAFEHTLADLDRVLAVDLTSVFLGCKYAIPVMIANGGGSIINLSPIASNHHLGPAYVSYPTTKAAINQFTKVTAAQYGMHNIRVNAILPGFIRTPMVELSVVDAFRGKAKLDDAERECTITEYLDKRNAQIPLGRWGEVWDVAKTALFLSSDDSAYISGIEMPVYGGAAGMLA
ncbi:MAG: SDR family oxidoreductase [Alphaproteobacteria bacterium]|nr:SDR family oxidoreductase [Alphaproteobacteria bacterium]